VPCHITQRGVDGRETFSCDNRADAEVAILGWCLMTNHAHLIALPAREDSLEVLLRRVHGRYAQYYNIRHGRTGHLWQNRYFACCLAEDHLWTALAYVDNNPVRAGLAPLAGDYRWSSARAHLGWPDEAGLLDQEWWTRDGMVDGWDGVLAAEQPSAVRDLTRCTHAGRPFGDEAFVVDLGERFGRRWMRGRPPKESTATASSSTLRLFVDHPRVCD
jgi:putative transposase